MTKLTVYGKTYAIKDFLGSHGFKWNPVKKTWSRLYNDLEAAKEMAHECCSHNGVTTTMTASDDIAEKRQNLNTKRYFVKEDWIFNLESMHDKCWVLAEDIREGRLQVPFEVAGKTINSEDDIDELRDEASQLEYAAKSNRGVTGKEYGRIRQIVAWRVMARYNACIASGMDEAKAGRCFEDM